MTIDEIRRATTDALQERRAAIIAEADAEHTTEELQAFTEEMRTINAELEARRAETAARNQLAAAVANGAGVVVNSVPQGGAQTRSQSDILESNEYVEAYANYVKSCLRGTPDAREARALLTENAPENGTLPVPTIVDSYVATAWERSGFLQLVRRLNVPGNLVRSFEISATDAVIHEEGSGPIDEEVLTLGKVTLIPKSIKKFIRISDEAYDMGGAAFLQYIYDEIANKIAEKTAEILLDAIIASPAASTATAPAVPVLSLSALSLDTIAQALGSLGSTARNPVIIMNRQTHAAFRALQLTANYAVDPYENLPVYYSAHLPAFSAAEAGATAIIVGDLYEGAVINHPNGEDIRLKFDDLSESEEDLIKIVGRRYAAIGVVAPNAFVKITKA